MPAEPHISTDFKYLPAGGVEVSYGLASRLASLLLIGSVAAMLAMPLAILWPLVGLADFFVVETFIRIVSAVGVFAFWWYVTIDIAWTFPRHETVVLTGSTLSISRRLCGVRVTRHFELRPGALGVQFETSWSSATKPRYRLHYESGGRKCDFARGLAEQSARELLRNLLHTESALVSHQSCTSD